MSVYKLYAAGTGGTEDSLASIDIQFDGVITAIHAQAMADLDADAETSLVEVSFLSSNTLATNDARGSLIVIGGRTATPMGGITNWNSGVGPLNIDVTAGERVHLHISAAAGVATSANVFLYVQDGSPAALRRRR